MVLFIFSLIFGIIAAIALLLGLGSLIVGKDSETKSFGAGSLVVFFICAVVATGMGLGGTIYTVGTGKVAVITTFGKVEPYTKPMGLHMKAPWQNVHQFSFQQQSYTISIAEGESTQRGEQPVLALTSDGMNLELDITIWYYLEADQAQTMFKMVGSNYVEKILKPAIRTSVRDCVKNFQATIAYTSGRDELQIQIQNKTIELIRLVPGAEGLQIIEINIRNIKLPDQITTAIEAKLEAQQQAQQMEFVLEKERLIAEQRVVEANGLALAQSIIDSSLTPAYLQWKYIETLKELVDSPNHSTIILPFDQELVPMLNIPSGGSDNST